MLVTETHSEGLQHEFKVVVPAGDIDEKLTTKLTDLSKSVNLPGFRPGKVPASLVKQRFGQSVMGEVLQETVDSSSQEAITEKGLKLALQPKIEITKFEEGSDLEYTMAVEVMPEIEPTDFAKLKLERLKSDVADADISAALEQVARDHKTFTPAKDGKAAETGDAVVIDFVGKVDGEPFEGGSAEGHRLELGAARFLPGFEDQLTGAKAGDKIDVKIRFPDDYSAKHLAGKDAVFAVEVKQVEQVKPHEINQELAKHVGLEDLDQLRDALRDQLAAELDGASRERLKRTLLDRLSENHDFDIPPTLLEQEFDIIWQQFNEVKKSGLMDLEDGDKPEDELKAEYRRIAERRVRLGLLIASVGEANNITVHQDEMNRALAERARRSPGQERQIMEFYQNNPQAMAQIRAPIFEEKVIDFILEKASVKERVVPREELFAPPEAPEKAAPRKKGEAKAKKEGPAKGTRAKAGAKKAAKPQAKKATGKEAAAKSGRKTAAKSKGSSGKAPAKKRATGRRAETR